MCVEMMEDTSKADCDKFDEIKNKKLEDIEDGYQSQKEDILTEIRFDNIFEQAGYSGPFFEQADTHLLLPTVTNEACDKIIASSDLSGDIFTSSPAIHPSVHLINPGPVISPSRGLDIQHLNIPLLGHLDPHNNGYLSPLSLISYWESLGVADGKQALEDLGLCEEQGRLDLRTVSQRLNEEILQGLELVSRPSVQAAIATVWDEVVIDKNTLDNVTKERDKFRGDVQEAQRRAAVQVMEIDEQNYQNDKENLEKLQDLEQKWVTISKALEKKTKLEFESHERTIQELKSNFENRKENFENIEKSMRIKIDDLEQRNIRLEEKIGATNIRLSESKELNISLKTAIKNSKILTGNLFSIDNFPKINETDPSNVEELIRYNKELKDRNDELETSMHSIQLQDCSPSNRKGCHLPESTPLVPDHLHLVLHSPQGEIEASQEMEKLLLP